MSDMVEYEEIGSPLSVSSIKHQVQVIQQVMKDVMVDGTHYGKIPGTDKPTLLKAGAEKLSLTFRLAPTYAITKNELGNGHREIEVKCTLTHIPSQTVFGEGVGSCSTMESKYRYRNVADYELTGETIPKDAKEKKKEYRKSGFGMKKVDGNWEWVKYKDSERTENPDIADTYNTVMKMAKKRAHVDAVLTATAASDIFAQDVEDLQPRKQFADDDGDRRQSEQPMPEYEDAHVVEARPAATAKVVVTDEIKNRVHNDTLYALEAGDSDLMSKAWEGFGADEKVELWRMFSSVQRSAIKKLQAGAKQ